MACAVMSACGVSQDNDQATTTSPAAAEETINPWDLPIEQRPALFDPCAEIPIEAVEQGVGGPVAVSDLLARHRPGELMTCGWQNREVHVTSVSTWKSREDFLSDPNFVIRNEEYEVSGRPGLRLVETGDNSDSTCIQLFFTGRGTVWVKLDLVGGLSEFRGHRFSEACGALDQAIGPIMMHLPQEDF